MRKAGAFSVFAASSIAAVLASGCSCSDKGAAPAANPQAETIAAPAVPSETQKKEEPIIPSATDRKMALQLGNQFMMQGKIEEAEEKYKIAAAGGSSEAEKMLLKIRTEKDAKQLMDAAKAKIDLGDYENAIPMLERIPQGSIQKAKADKLIETIKAKKEADERAMEENLRKGMERAFAAEDDSNKEEEAETVENQEETEASEEAQEAPAPAQEEQEPAPEPSAE